MFYLFSYQTYSPAPHNPSLIINFLIHLDLSPTPMWYKVRVQRVFSLIGKQIFSQYLPLNSLPFPH